MNTVSASNPDVIFSVILPRPLRALEPENVAQIEQALSEVGPDGEVSLIIENGDLQRIETLRPSASKVDPAASDKGGSKE